MNRRTFITTIGKLAAVVGITPHVKAEQPQSKTKPEWAADYMLEPSPRRGEDHSLDAIRYRFDIPPRHGKTLMMENQLRKQIGMPPRYE